MKTCKCSGYMMKFFNISAGMGFCFGEFIQLKDSFGFFKNPRWCFRKGVLMYIFNGYF